MQRDTAIGVNLKTREQWSVDLPLMGSTPARPLAEGSRGISTITVANGTQVEVRDGLVILNGNSVLGSVDSIQVRDENGNLLTARLANDADSLRRAVFAPLGAQSRFMTGGLIGGKLILMGSTQIAAFNVADGKHLPWMDRDGKPLTVRLPDGAASSFVGNDDVLMVQMDAANGKSSTFTTYDLQTGTQKKQQKIEDGTALWRALADDGTLFVETAQSLAAYDIMSPQSQAIWRKNNIGSRYASASALDA